MFIFLFCWIFVWLLVCVFFFHLHRAASQLLIQLYCKECRGCNFILSGMSTLPERQGKIWVVFLTFSLPTHAPYRDEDKKKQLLLSNLRSTSFNMKKKFTILYCNTDYRGRWGHFLENKHRFFSTFMSISHYPSSSWLKNMPVGTVSRKYTCSTYTDRTPFDFSYGACLWPLW